MCGKTYSLGPIDQIPVGEGREFSLGGTLVAIFRGRGGHLYATQASCPHQGGRLADGIVGGGQVICPLHTFRFDLQDGRAASSGCDSLRTYDVWLSGEGRVMVRVDM